MVVCWQSSHAQFVGAFITSGSHEITVLDKSLSFAWIPTMHSPLLSSKLAFTCPVLYPVILQVCFISFASVYDWGCNRSGEAAEQYPPEVLLAASSSHFPDQPALPLKPTAADCRACHCYQFCPFITKSAWLFLLNQTYPNSYCSIGVV